MFSHISGQPKAVTLLRRAIESGRLAHGYLFSGPEGVGKLSTAKAMAASLFCLAGQGPPCGVCTGCKKFSSENHPDFIHIVPDGVAIKIDQVRELKKNMVFSPFEARTRIVVIEDVHTMRREAANSLLKLLEEPPPDNLLLLLASDSEPILETIVSRCQVIPFYSLPLPLAADVLQERSPELDRESSLALAELLEGAPGRADSMDTEKMLTLRREIIETLLGGFASEALIFEAALRLAAKTAAFKDDLISILELLRVYFKECMIFQLGGDRRKNGGQDLRREIVQSRERWNLEDLSDKVQAIEFALQALGRNCNRTSVCDVLFLQLLTT